MDCVLTALAVADSVASIITAGVAAAAGIYYLHQKCARRTRLEEYLAERKKTSSFRADQGVHTLPHLMAKLGMTESEIYEAAFSSKKVQALVTTEGETGRADAVVFGLKPVPKSKA